MTSGVPSSSRNCFGVSAPMRVPRPAAGSMAATRLIVDATRRRRLTIGPQTSECTSTRRVRRIAGRDRHRDFQKKWSFPLLEIDARNALAHGTKKIGSYRADAARDDIGRMYAIPVRAVNRDRIADFGARNIGHVDHRNVHGDNSNNGGKQSANQNAAAIAERTVNAVAVTGGEDGDARGTLGDESFVVADARPNGNVADIDDARAQAHHRLDGKKRLNFRAPLGGIVAGMIAVQNRAGTNHVGPGVGTRGDGGAVGEMHDAGIDPESTESIERGVKALFLLTGLLSRARAGKNLGRGEMREDPAQFQMLAFCELSGEAIHIAGSDSQAIHACVHLQME